MLNEVRDIPDIEDEPVMTFLGVGIYEKDNKLVSEYEYAKTLNTDFTNQDKIDFIYCAYEVAYIDENPHFMVEHLIKKIADILNIEREELVKSKKEMKKIFNL